MVKAKSFRSKVEEWAEHNTLEDAMRIAHQNWYSASAVTVKIIDGDNVYDIVDIHKYWEEKGWYKSI